MRVKSKVNHIINVFQFNFDTLLVNIYNMNMCYKHNHIDLFAPKLDCVVPFDKFNKIKSYI